jgi:signal transduction histidine kinase
MVKVRLQKVGNKIELLISDNGKGIDKREINSLKSMGLAGIRERAKSASGRFLIISAKKSGTTLKVAIPLKPNK